VNCYFVGVFSDDSYKTFAHRSLSTLCERKTEDILGQRVGFRQNIRDAYTQEFSLSCAWSGNNHNWPFDSVDGLFLGNI